MISVPRYTKEELNVFEGKKVIIGGSNRLAIEIHSIFRNFNINVIGLFCTKVDVISDLEMLYDTSIVGLEELAILAKDDDVIIQEIDQDVELSKLIDKYAINRSKFDARKIFHSFIIQNFIDLVRQNNLAEVNRYVQLRIERKRVLYNSLIEQIGRKSMEYVIICSPPKTGDHTLNNTFNLINETESRSNRYNLNRIIAAFICKTGLNKMSNSVSKYEERLKNKKKIDYVNIFHSPELFKKNLYNNKTIKIITAMREPIVSNLSLVFQHLGASLGMIHQQILPLLIQYGKDDFLNIAENIFVKGMDDVQILFDSYIKERVNSNIKIIPESVAPMQDFFPLFNENIVNLYEHPFDKEKGYSIIKEGNIEVFVYQLEKLNSIVPELSKWIGVPFDKLENGNVAADKWAGESYKQAQKEIEISQEYFDRCYNEEYVKHFYSEEDIEKFKARWRPHIKK